MNRTRRRTAMVAALTALVLAACGGGDEVSIPAPTDPAPTAPPDDTVVPPADAPATSGDVDVEPTIAPDVPEEFLPGIGPLAVIGEPLPPAPASGDDPALGMTAPVLVGENFDGERVRLDPGADGPTWVIFLAHWCPHCNDEIPVINELRDDGLIPDGIDVVAVSTAANPDRPNFPPGTWLDDMDWTFEAIADGVDIERGVYIAADAYGVNSFPFSVLVDGDGVVTTRWSGERTPTDLVSLLTDNLPSA